MYVINTYTLRLYGEESFLEGMSNDEQSVFSFYSLTKDVLPTLQEMLEDLSVEYFKYLERYNPSEHFEVAYSEGVYSSTEPTDEEIEHELF